MVTCTGHIGIHDGVDGRTDVVPTHVRTDVYDVMAIKPNFLTSMGYHTFLTMVLRARSSAINCFRSKKKKKKKKYMYIYIYIFVSISSPPFSY